MFFLLKEIINHYQSLHIHRRHPPVLLGPSLLVIWHPFLCYIIIRTRNSRVRPMSRIDLTPAETTVMGVLPSSIRSALMSRPEGKSTIIINNSQPWQFCCYTWRTSVTGWADPFGGPLWTPLYSMCVLWQSHRLPVCLLFSPPLWTPPMPPVTKTWMPAWCAAIIVADTVVPPESPWKNTKQGNTQALPWMTDWGGKPLWGFALYAGTHLTLLRT